MNDQEVGKILNALPYKLKKRQNIGFNEIKAWLQREQKLAKRCGLLVLSLGILSLLAFIAYGLADLDFLVLLAVSAFFLFHEEKKILGEHIR